MPATNPVQRRVDRDTVLAGTQEQHRDDAERFTGLAEEIAELAVEYGISPAETKSYIDAVIRDAYERRGIVPPSKD